MTDRLVIDRLNVQVEGKHVLKDLSLTIPSGEVHALMGPNGSGKSSLAQTLLGHPRYRVVSGNVTFGPHDILAMKPEERAAAGLFLSFQSPVEIPGLQIGPYLRTILARGRPEPISIDEALQKITPALHTVGLPDAILERGLNEGFSGGERKRLEILQLLILEPRLAILDETDSGLDVDALKTIAASINAMRRPDRGFLVITHYRRLLDLLRPDRVHVLVDGRIAQSGGFELVDAVEKSGYDSHQLPAS